MNRTIIAVKAGRAAFGNGTLPWASIRLHWQHGKEVEDWLRENYSSHRDALDLIMGGHREYIDKSYSDMGYSKVQWWEHRTLREAKANEHLTFAWHNGKQWRFKHLPTGG